MWDARSALAHLGNLDKGEAQLGQPLRQLRCMLSKPGSEPVYEVAEPIYGEPRFFKVGRAGAQVKRCELEEAKAVVGHHHCSWGGSKLAAQLLKTLLGLAAVCRLVRSGLTVASETLIFAWRSGRALLLTGLPVGTCPLNLACATGGRDGSFSFGCPQGPHDW